jgi:hypothetical protein
VAGVVAATVQEDDGVRMGFLGADGDCGNVWCRHGESLGGKVNKEDTARVRGWNQILLKPFMFSGTDAVCL